MQLNESRSSKALGQIERSPVVAPEKDKITVREEAEPPLLKNLLNTTKWRGHLISYPIEPPKLSPVIVEKSLADKYNFFEAEHIDIYNRPKRPKTAPCATVTSSSFCNQLAAETIKYPTVNSQPPNENHPKAINNCNPVSMEMEEKNYHMDTVKATSELQSESFGDVAPSSVQRPQPPTTTPLLPPPPPLTPATQHHSHSQLCTNNNHISPLASVGQMGNNFTHNYLNFTNSMYVLPFSCMFCTFQCSDALTLQNHITLIHTNQTSLICTLCQTKIAQVRNLQQHFAAHQNHQLMMKHSQFCCEGHMKEHTEEQRTHEANYHNCSMCDYQCSDALMFSNHVKSHTKQVLCNMCGYVCQTETELEQHMRENHTELICEKCGYTCENDTQLDQHMIESHTESSQLVCDRCGYIFQDETELDQHVGENHPESEQLFTCKHCAFKSPNKIDRDEHMEKHHFKFSCAVSDLHGNDNFEPIKQQTISKVFSCKLCSYKTEIEENLKSHVAQHATVGNTDVCRNVNGSGSGLKTKIRRLSGSNHNKARRTRANSGKDEMSDSEEIWTIVNDFENENYAAKKSNARNSGAANGTWVVVNNSSDKYSNHSNKHSKKSVISLDKNANSTQGILVNSPDYNTIDLSRCINNSDEHVESSSETANISDESKNNSEVCVEPKDNYCKLSRKGYTPHTSVVDSHKTAIDDCAVCFINPVINIETDSGKSVDHTNKNIDDLRNLSGEDAEEEEEDEDEEGEVVIVEEEEEEEDEVVMVQEEDYDDDISIVFERLSKKPNVNVPRAVNVDEIAIDRNNYHSSNKNTLHLNTSDVDKQLVLTASNISDDNNNCKESTPSNEENTTFEADRNTSVVEKEMVVTACDNGDETKQHSIESFQIIQETNPKHVFIKVNNTMQNFDKTVSNNIGNIVHEVSSEVIDISDNGQELVNAGTKGTFDYDANSKVININDNSEKLVNETEKNSEESVNNTVQETISMNNNNVNKVVVETLKFIGRNVEENSHNVGTKTYEADGRYADEKVENLNNSFFVFFTVDTKSEVINNGYKVLGNVQDNGNILSETLSNILVNNKTIFVLQVRDKSIKDKSSVEIDQSLENKMIEMSNDITLQRLNKFFVENEASGAKQTDNNDRVITCYHETNTIPVQNYEKTKISQNNNDNLITNHGTDICTVESDDDTDGKNRDDNDIEITKPKSFLVKNDEADKANQDNNDRDIKALETDTFLVEIDKVGEENQDKNDEEITNHEIDTFVGKDNITEEQNRDTIVEDITKHGIYTIVKGNYHAEDTFIVEINDLTHEINQNIIGEEISNHDTSIFLVENNHTEEKNQDNNDEEITNHEIIKIDLASEENQENYKKEITNHKICSDLSLVENNITEAGEKVDENYKDVYKSALENFVKKFKNKDDSIDNSGLKISRAKHSNKLSSKVTTDIGDTCVEDLDLTAISRTNPRIMVKINLNKFTMTDAIRAAMREKGIVLKKSSKVDNDNVYRDLRNLTAAEAKLSPRKNPKETGIKKPMRSGRATQNRLGKTGPSCSKPISTVQTCDKLVRIKPRSAADLCKSTVKNVGRVEKQSKKPPSNKILKTDPELKIIKAIKSNKLLADKLKRILELSSDGSQNQVKIAPKLPRETMLSPARRIRTDTNDKKSIHRSAGNVANKRISITNSAAKKLSKDGKIVEHGVNKTLSKDKNNFPVIRDIKETMNRNGVAKKGKITGQEAKKPLSKNLKNSSALRGVKQNRNMNLDKNLGTAIKIGLENLSSGTFNKVSKRSTETGKNNTSCEPVADVTNRRHSVPSLNARKSDRSDNEDLKKFSEKTAIDHIFRAAKLKAQTRRKSEEQCLNNKSLSNAPRCHEGGSKYEEDMEKSSPKLIGEASKVHKQDCQNNEGEAIAIECTKPAAGIMFQTDSGGRVMEYTGETDVIIRKETTWKYAGLIENSESNFSCEPASVKTPNQNDNQNSINTKSYADITFVTDSGQNTTRCAGRKRPAAAEDDAEQEKRSEDRTASFYCTLPYKTTIPSSIRIIRKETSSTSNWKITLY